MIEVSIAAEGLFGLSWPEWKRLVRTVDDLGFTGLYLSDHFLLPDPPDYPSIEMIVALTYLADQSERLRFGPRVSPLSFRDPVMLARQAATLDDLSGGRMSLGVGAGWMDREHAMFGYELGDIPTRFARLEEGLEVITRLLRSDEPVTFEGRFYRLRDAVLPVPRRPGGPEVVVGGSGPKRTLPLVARYADGWNAGNVGPETLRERTAQLDELLAAEGRLPEDVRRSLNLPVLCYRTPEELETRIGRARRFFHGLRNAPADQVVEFVRSWPGLLGTPEEIVSQIRAFEAAGITEIELKWVSADDIEGLEILAREVLPQVTSLSA